MRGKQSAGAARLGGLYETARHGVHNLSEGALAVGSAARMAGDSWRLARDSQPERCVLALCLSCTCCMLAACLLCEKRLSYTYYGYTNYTN